MTPTSTTRPTTGNQFKSGGGAVPGARISGVTIDRSNNGSGVLAMGSATLTDVTITGSAEGDVAIGPGSQFVINRWRPLRALLRPAGPCSTRACGPVTRAGVFPGRVIPSEGAQTGDFAGLARGSRGGFGASKSG